MSMPMTATTNAHDLPSLCQHAWRRMKQRGIRRETLALVVNHADAVVPAGGGCELQSLSARQLSDLRERGVPAALLERAQRLTVLVDDDGRIVTVYRRDRRWRPCMPRPY